jgi:hypothetical protein
MPRHPSLNDTVPALVALYGAGAAWAAADGLASFGHALLNGSDLNAPLVIVAAQAIGAVAACRLGGRRASAGAVLTLLACTVSLAAVAFDGDLGQAGLSAAQVGYQLAIAGVTLATWVLAAARLAPARRGAGEARGPGERPAGRVVI